MEGAPYLKSSQRTRLGSMAGILGRKDHTGGMVDRVTSGKTARSGSGGSQRTGVGGESLGGRTSPVKRVDISRETGSSAPK
jgi:hypothetical protein